MPTFQMENLKTLCSNILKKVGASEEESLIVADNLVKANLRGIDSHGVRLLPAYIERVKAALIKTDASIQVVKERPSTALMDGGSGFGQVVGVKAMELAVKKAKSQGIATVGAFKTNHFGFAAYYSMIALDHDMIGIAMTNGAPTMAPWGGESQYNRKQSNLLFDTGWRGEAYCCRHCNERRS